MEPAKTHRNIGMLSDGNNGMEPASQQTQLGDFADCPKVNDSRVCPECGDVFKNERGVKRHHYIAHGESLAKSSYECEWCGETFKKYDCHVNNDIVFCSEDCRDIWRAESDFNEGAKNDRYKGEDGETSCDWCGCEFRRRPSDLSYYENNFCSLECKYQWHSESMRGDNHPLWKPSSSSNYGVLWDERREKAIQRDNSKCVLCGLSRDIHRECYGCDLHVHHKIPRRTFEDKKEADKLDNLITVCKSCHHSIEPISQKRA